jgi:hypothetical protein
MGDATGGPGTERIREERADLEREFTDLGHLPKAKRVEGEPPDEHPRWGSILIDWIHDRAEKNKPNAVEGARFRHSDAGICARALAYAALGVESSNPPEPDGYYIFWLGDVIHEAFQAAVKEKFGDAAEVEVKVGEPGSTMGGHIDVVVKLETGNTKPYVVSIEVKSQGGFGFKLASAQFQGPPEGPKLTHKRQSFLNAKAIDADEAVVLYFAKDPNNWVKEGMDPLLRVVAEWTYTREQYEPEADEEIARIQGILSLLDDEKMLPARKVPELGAQNHLILDPTKGEWANIVDGHPVFPDKYKPYWGCGYCRYQDTCAQTGAEREPVDVLVQLGVLGVEAGDVAKVTKDSHPIVETDDDGQRHVVVADDTGETEVIHGDPHDVHKFIVDAEREINREDQQP